MRLSRFSVEQNAVVRSKVASTFSSVWLRLYVWMKMVIVPYEQISRFVPKNGEILDIGCGYGVLSIFLALESFNRRVLGIDPNSSRIRAVEQLATRKTSNAVFRSVDVASQKGSIFDCVVMEEVLHHVPKDEQQCVLNTVASILAQTGVFILRENNKRLSFRYILVNLPAEYLLYPTEEKANFRTNEELVVMLRKAEFDCQIIPAPWYSLVDISIFVCRKLNI